MDIKTFKELLGLDNDPDFNNLNDKALEGLRDLLKKEFNFSEGEEIKLTEE